MKISELIENLPSMAEDEREKVLLNLIPKLTPISRRTLTNFQNGWDSNKSWNEFRKAQDEEILQCLRMECHQLGVEVRQALNLEPISLDTEI